MKKVTITLAAWWKAETPRLAKAFQVLSGAIAALPLYYAALPDEFKQSIPQNYLKWVVIGGAVTAFILQFFNKKQTV